ncbi:MAG: flagellar basal body rod C-terminal domain-containing protein, partial [Hyphomicrobiaceae bacterium]
DPYTRKTISFVGELDQVSGATMVEVDRIGLHNAPFRIEHDPGHPAADEKGFVKLPNVNIMVEMADMSEARRVYEANLQVIKQARNMISMTIGLLQGR